MKTLPAKNYVTQETHQEERRAIFAAAWHLAGRSSALRKPGDYLLASDLPIPPTVIVRKPDGGLGAFQNVCRHRAGPLVVDTEGSLAATALTCRYHGWSYDLEGTLKRAPGIDPCPAVALFPMAVREWNGLVFLHADPARDDLTAWLGGVEAVASAYPKISEMDFIGAVEMRAACNWKAYGDNSCEGWHVPFVHRTLKHNTSEEDIAISCREDGAFVLFDVRYRPTREDPTRDGNAAWIYKFPGLLLHFAEETINIETVIPLGPDATLLRRYFFADRDALRRKSLTAEAVIDASRAVMQEDIAIAETVQRNLAATAYDTGYLSREREPGTVFFQALVRHALDR